MYRVAVILAKGIYISDAENLNKIITFFHLQGRPCIYYYNYSMCDTLKDRCITSLCDIYLRMKCGRIPSNHTIMWIIILGPDLLKFYTTGIFRVL